MMDVMRRIVKSSLDPQVDPIFDDFHIIDAFKESFMKEKREFRLTVLDKKTSSTGLMVMTNKKLTKEAIYRLFEDMRFLCRARNLDCMYGLASNLYDFQIIFYNRQLEIQSEDDYFGVSPGYKLYVRDNGY